MQLLAISGSLRRDSGNTALLKGAARLAPPGVSIIFYDGLATLPPFNPDFDDTPPEPVIDFRRRVAEADGVLISSPEYAAGVSGVMKNALDWLVGSGELVDKPVALINASPRATLAHQHLSGTLVIMSARLIPEASITLPMLGRSFGAGGIAAEPDIAGPLRAALAAFVAAIRSDSTRPD